MKKASFFKIFGARGLQIIGFGLAFYGVFIAAFSQAIKLGSGNIGTSLTWLIPPAGVIIFIWGSKILYDNGHNILH